MTVRYDVEKIAYASHLKANIQAMLRGHFYLRELATSESEVKFENIFEPKEQSFELEYVDGRQILVGLVNEVPVKRLLLIRKRSLFLYTSTSCNIN